MLLCEVNDAAEKLCTEPDFAVIELQCHLEEYHFETNVERLVLDMLVLTSPLHFNASGLYWPLNKPFEILNEVVDHHEGGYPSQKAFPLSHQTEVVLH